MSVSKKKVMASLFCLMFVHIIALPLVTQVSSASDADLFYYLKQKFKNIPQVTADISFLMADLKYKDGQIKICEFGEGTLSRFKGHDKMFGKGTLWSMFWQHVGQFKLPLFYVGPPFGPQGAQDDRTEIGYNDFIKVGGCYIQNLSNLEQYKPFIKAASRSFNPIDVAGHKGLLVFRYGDASRKVFQDFRKAHPGFLVLNTVPAPYVNNKYFTNILFQEPFFEKYKPKFMLCETKYYQELAAQIQERLGCTKFVIKPLGEFKGRGVIIVDADKLDQTLRIILHNKKGQWRSVDKYIDELYNYWHHVIRSNNSHFLVEEYCPSKTIELEGKLYDPTMRVVFALQYSEGTMHVTYFDAFWKFPTRALSDEVSLTEKHKSLGTIPLPVSDEDKKDVINILNGFLPQLYEKMIRLINE